MSNETAEAYALGAATEQEIWETEIAEAVSRTGIDPGDLVGLELLELLETAAALAYQMALKMGPELSAHVLDFPVKKEV